MPSVVGASVSSYWSIPVRLGHASTFEKNVRSLLVDQEGLAPIVLPMLEAWRSMRIRAAELGKQLFCCCAPKPSLSDPHLDPRRRRDHSDLFRNRHEVDYDGHISRRGDRHLRGLLYEAATVILTRRSANSGLRTWGSGRGCFKRAAVAVARKLAVTMHAMLKTGALFDRTSGATA